MLKYLEKKHSRLHWNKNKCYKLNLICKLWFWRFKRFCVDFLVFNWNGNRLKRHGFPRFREFFASHEIQVNYVLVCLMNSAVLLLLIIDETFQIDFLKAVWSFILGFLICLNSHLAHLSKNKRNEKMSLIHFLWMNRIFRKCVVHLNSEHSKYYGLNRNQYILLNNCTNLILYALIICSKQSNYPVIISSEQIN